MANSSPLTDIWVGDHCKPPVDMGLIKPQPKSILENFRTEIKLWCNFSLPYMLKNFAKFCIEGGMLAITV